MKLKATLAAGAALGMAAMTMPAPAQAQADPFLGQMMGFGGNFCPRGWSTTDGQLLAISQYQALFSLLGTMYGGDGRTTFGLPDLRGRAPIHQGQGPGLPNYRQGEKGGAVEFTLTVAQMPAHDHTGRVRATNAPADTNNPVRNDFAVAPAGTNVYADNTAPNNNMAANSVQTDNTGSGLPVNKVSPFQAIQWCIALQGVFPPRN